MFAPTPVRPAYACGWEIKDYFGNRFVGHSGGTDGVECFFYRFVDAGYTIITLSNYDGGNGQLCSDIEAILFGRPYEIPTVVDADFALGYALQGRGRHREAVAVFAGNLDREPPHLLSLFLSAHSRILGDFELEKAADELDRYIRLADEDAWPPVAMAWSKRASALAKIGRTEEAKACYERALALDPSDANTREKLRKLRRAPLIPAK